MSIRVLHVLGSMDAGGVENWLMNLSRAMDKDELYFDFLVHREKKALFDDELLSLGLRKYYISPRNVILYFFRLFMLLRKNEYDVVHSHVHFFSGVVMVAAWLAGVKVRISHSHNAIVLKNDGFFKRLYYFFMGMLIKAFYTQGISVSMEAKDSLFGKGSNDPRNIIFYCCIDVLNFKNEFYDVALKKELGFNEKDIIVGNVSRFSEQKNHLFLIEIFAEICRINENYKLLLVGDGELKKVIINKAKDLNVLNRIIFSGIRKDVHKVMKIMDVFLFPSLWEGLPLTVVEAQASGLRCLLSDAITKEVNMGSCEYLSLGQKPQVWAKHLDQMIMMGRNNETPIALLSSEFYVTTSISKLIDIYSGSL